MSQNFLKHKTIKNQIRGMKNSLFDHMISRELKLSIK